MTKLTVLVSGASGMVGFHLVQHLAARGHTLKALVRATSSMEALTKLSGDVLLVVSELTDYDALVESMKGVDVVVHAAGSVSSVGRRQEIMDTNVGLTRACLEAAIEASVKQFVHISSLAVITGQEDQFAVTEEAPLKYCGEAYADSKVDAEKLVSAETSRERIKVTVLRPGFIYGPGERAWMPRLIESLRLGKAMLIDGGTRETNVIYIGNLLRAAEASLMNPRAFGQVYNLTDGQQVTKKQLFDAVCDGLGFPRVTRSIPQAVARAVCELVSSVAPYCSSPMQRQLSRFSRAAFRLAGVNQGFSISKAEHDLDYVDRIAFAEGMQETLKHFIACEETPALTPGFFSGRCGRDSSPCRIPCKHPVLKDGGLINQVGSGIKAFVIDYSRRHNHPANACLHLIGVPMTVWGIYLLFTGGVIEGLCSFVGGYFLQYLGHRAQGNEVGEVMLLKGCWRHLKALGGARHG